MALPSGYTEMPYLESTGTQYIDTLVSGSTIGKIETKFAYTSITTGAYRNYFGVEESGKPYKALGFRVESDSSIFNFYARDISQNITADISTHSMSIVIDTSDYTLNFDGNSYTKLGTEAISDLALTLFASRRGSSTVDRFGCVKLFNFKIYNTSDTLIRDFVPAVRKSDNIIGLYDTVNDKFYANSGTGTFYAPIPQSGTDYYIINRTEHWKWEKFATTQTIPQLTDFEGKIYTEVRYFNDSQLSLSMNLADSYTARCTTWCYCPSAFSQSITFNSDDASTTWLNGTKIATCSAYNDAKTVTVEFKAGWNCLQVCYTEGSGGDGWILSPRLDALTGITSRSAEAPMVNIITTISPNIGSIDNSGFNIVNTTCKLNYNNNDNKYLVKQWKNGSTVLSTDVLTYSFTVNASKNITVILQSHGVAMV